jgi:hypothetical protein
MQIFSGKSFDFGEGTRISKGEFKTVPDAVKKTRLFKWALKEGSVRIITPAAKELTDETKRE